MNPKIFQALWPSKNELAGHTSSLSLPSSIFCMNKSMCFPIIAMQMLFDSFPFLFQKKKLECIFISCTLWTRKTTACWGDLMTVGAARCISLFHKLLNVHPETGSGPRVLRHKPCHLDAKVLGKTLVDDRHILC